MEQDYNWCVVIGGNFFSLIPLVQYWDNILSQIQKYFGALDTASGWTQLVFKAADTICDALCDAGAPSGGCSLCELKNWAAAVGQVVADVMDLAREEAWTGAGDKCGKALEGIGEIRDRVNAVEGAQTTTPTF
jgi:hypothetical protein